MFPFEWRVSKGALNFWSPSQLAPEPFLFEAFPPVEAERPARRRRHMQPRIEATLPHGANRQTRCRNASNSRPLAGNVRNPATHAAIVEAAIAILNERGYGGFTIDAVARRSGAGKPTIYRWWKTKSELFMELYNRESAAMMPVEDLGSMRAELSRRSNRSFISGGDCLRPGLSRDDRRIAGGREVSGAAARPIHAAAPQSRPHDPGARTAARRVGRRTIETALDLLYGFSIYHLITGQLQDEGAIEAMVDLLIQGLTATKKLQAAEQVIDRPQRRTKLIDRHAKDNHEYHDIPHRAVDEERSKPWRPWHPLTRTAQKKVNPGEITEYAIEILATANLFRRGHRICIEVASADMPTGVAGATNKNRIHP